MKTLAYSSVCALGAMMVACVGTDTGNPVGGGTTGTGGPSTGGNLGEGGFGCEEVDSEEVALDSQTSLGVTADEVLALAEGEHEFELTWGAEPADWSGFAGTTTTLRVSVNRDPEGSARLVDLEEPASSTEGPLHEGPALGGGCSDQLEVDVRIDLITEDGALDEHFASVLRSSDGLQAGWSAKIEADSIEGSFDYQPSLQGLRLTAISPRMTHSALGARGDLGVESQSEGPNGVASASSIARWPTASDCHDGFTAELDTRVGETSIADALAEAEGALPAQIAWPDSEAAALSWTITLDEGSGCASLSNEAYGEGYHLQATGTAQLESDDGRLQATVPVRFEARADENGTLHEASLHHGSRVGRLTPAELDTTYGLSDVDVGSYAEVSVEIRWSVDVQAPEDATGTFVVYGLDVPDCISMPQPPPSSGPGSGGSAGCRGIDSTPILEAEL